MRVDDDTPQSFRSGIPELLGTLHVGVQQGAFPSFQLIECGEVAEWSIAPAC